MPLDVATTLDTYEWLAGGDFRYRWALETSTDPLRDTTGTPEDVSDVTAVRMWLQQQVARGVTPPAPIAYTNTGGQIAIDATGYVANVSPAYLVATLTAADGVNVALGVYDVLVSFDRTGGVKDDVARFVLEHKQGPRPAP
jgi:hypothetical protein